MRRHLADLGYVLQSLDELEVTLLQLLSSCLSVETYIILTGLKGLNGGRMFAEAEES